QHQQPQREPRALAGPSSHRAAARRVAQLGLVLAPLALLEDVIADQGNRLVALVLVVGTAAGHDLAALVVTEPPQAAAGLAGSVVAARGARGVVRLHEILARAGGRQRVGL